jgi:hypothetical protein
MDFVHDELSVIGERLGIAEVATMLGHQDLRGLIVLKPVLKLFL